MQSYIAALLYIFSMSIVKEAPYEIEGMYSIHPKITSLKQAVHV